MKIRPLNIPLNTCLTIAPFLSCLFLCVQTASATPLYWDLNGATANTGTSAGGNWNGSTANWNTALSGTGGTPQATTAAADDLFFSSGTGYTAGGTANLTVTALANSVTFEEGNVTISGTGGTLAFGSGAGSISVASTLTSTISAFITGTNGLTKTGAGVLILGNTANSGLTGTISIKAGALVSGSNTTNSTNGQLISLGDTDALSTASATFSVNRNQNYTSNVIVNAGSSGVKRISGGPGLTSQQTPGITGTLTLNDDVTFGNGASGIYTGNNFGGVGLAGSITGSAARTITVDGFTAYTNVSTYLNNITSGSLAVTQARLTANNAAFLGIVNVSRGSLVLGHATALGASNVVSIESNGVLDVINSVSIAGLNDLSGSGGGVTTSANGVATLTLAGTGTYSFSGIVSNGANGNVNSVTNLAIGTGSSTTNQTLSGANSHVGTTIVASGSKLTIGNADALGNKGYTKSSTVGGTTVSSGGTLDLNGQTGINEVITLNGTGSASTGALINGSGSAASIGSGLSSINVGGTLTGLTAGTAVSITDGGGSGATAVASLGVTAATFGTVTVAGTYTQAPTVTISGGGGSGATATVGLTGVLTITNAGSGFTSTPTVAFTGGTGGTSMTATANSTNFLLSGVSVTANGTGFTSAPTVSLSSGSVTTTGNLTSVILASNSSIGGTGDIAINSVVSGGFALTKVGVGKVTLAGTNTYTGLLTLTGGILNAATTNINGSSTANGITFDGGTLQVATGGISTGKAVLMTGTGTFDTAGNASELSGNITGGGLFTKSGANSLTLSGAANTFSGGLTIGGGSVIANNANTGVLGSGLVTMANNTTLDLKGNSPTTGLLNTSGIGTGVSITSSAAGTPVLTISGTGTATFAGVIENGSATSVGLTKSGAGTQILSGANSYTGITTVGTGGTLSVSTLANGGANSGIGASANTAANLVINGTLQYTGGSVGTDRDFSGSSGTIEVTQSNAILMMSGTSFVNFTKKGAGTLDLTGLHNSLSGVVVNAGTLVLSRASGNALGTTVTVSGGTLQLGSTNTANTDLIHFNAALAMSGSGVFDLNGHALEEIRQLDGGVSNFITNSAASGTSVLQVGANGGGGTFAGVIQDGPNGGKMALTKLTSLTTGGTLTLTGANTYTGATTLNAGILRIFGSIGNSDLTVSNADSTLASGATGTIGNNVTLNSGTILAAGGNLTIGKATVGSATTLNSGSIFSWDLTSTPTDSTSGVRGTDYDAINTASLGATNGAIFRVVLQGNQDFSDTFWNTSHAWTDIFKTADAGSALDFETIFSGGIQYYNSVGNVGNLNTVGGSFTITGSSLNWSAVPEPTSALAGVLMAAGLLRRKRCRH